MNTREAFEGRWTWPCPSETKQLTIILFEYWPVSSQLLRWRHWGHWSMSLMLLDLKLFN